MITRGGVFAFFAFFLTFSVKKKLLKMFGRGQQYIRGSTLIESKSSYDLVPPPAGVRPSTKFRQGGFGNKFDILLNVFMIVCTISTFHT